MKQITIKLPDPLIDILEERATEEYDGNRSEAARELLERGAEYDDLERENDRLREQLRATNSRQDDVDELVRYVEDELSYRDAGLATRAKWWLFGRDRDGNEGAES